MKISNTNNKIYMPSQANKRRHRKEDDEGARELRSTVQKVVMAAAFVIFMIYAVTLIYPFFYILNNSFKTAAEFTSNFNGFPREGLYFNNFYNALMYTTTTSKINILTMFAFSVFLSVGGTLLTVLSSSTASYVIAKYKFPGKEIIHTIVIFSMIVPVVGTLPATLQLLKAMKIYNTPIAILFLYSGGFGTNFLLLYSFFKGLSWGYAEAAFIDGASDFKIFYKIMIPLARGPIVAISIITFIGLWNDYTNPAIFLPSLPTLAVGLQQIIEDLINKHEYPQIFSSVIIAMLPILILFICFSKTIMTNTSVGGLKG